MTELPNYFAADVADDYDAGDGHEFQAKVIAETADVLAALAAGGRALELAIGTGRVALPLAARGVSVTGIEYSTDMVAQLRRKPGGDAIPVTMGDMASARVAGEFSLVYLVFNTIMNLTTQDAQVDCFANASAHLVPGGRFVIEVMVPELRKLPPGQRAVPFQTGPDVWAFDLYDTASQAHSSNYGYPATGRFASLPFRYVWPSELDLMARMAGMTLEHRWADWDRSPFEHESTKHVSVWRKG
ncbi:class I SAM-dependent DNA methyltransferase [Pendulispora albinea]|uniref:Class I SAM-dependent methyltransferase n=1 Tax=Pendulispora albinea TaxID=2741071 RepID=A0ABZ2M0K3_9BACT